MTHSPPHSALPHCEELDAELASTLVGFVGSHLQMKNTLEKAKAEMDAASKAAKPRRAQRRRRRLRQRAEYGIHSVCSGRQATEPAKPAPQKPASLFDMPSPVATDTTLQNESEEELGFAEVDDDEPIDESEELDDAA